MEPESNVIARLLKTLTYVLDTPIDYFRETIVVPNQKKYPWYHQKFRRVPTIDECYELDIVCLQEANSQFQRDKMVEDEILSILRNRYEHCCWVHGEDSEKLCSDLYKTYDDAAKNWFIKYGDLGIKLDARSAFMKQKHRMIWERRHGPVGSGMNDKYV
ncbi:NADH dehydrogenase (ubiquinone) PDSW subunit [Osmia lignaria lignaria]|uniref:NADH dehydrogenase [ubiquinone] 1 beta subcomplex subunit 10 n=1 Tax=Osmia bicornis bicornis TaxID=1437191 RepID=UPI0010F78EF0|nr:NADH dehydrogenase [ubiquinone] 1 beta subcomplex subunit 10 [Osmia bicornis bicornis]XP_034191773.1 NADH dehydrogenase [ubiquinone] 1 beta subcomplex subunit 10 [Osmia lignaria]